MSAFQVNLVTAFGRGETLALALKAASFDVRVLDFTAGFPPEYQRGPGPFPIARQEFLRDQQSFLAEVETLPRGLAFWLEDGPLELSGPMASFYGDTRKDVKALRSGAASAEFRNDWLRRFLNQWTSPFQSESWAPTRGHASTIFPWERELGVIPAYDEQQVLSFERLPAKGVEVVSCQAVDGATFENSRLVEISVRKGETSVVQTGAQWVWCLSSRETEILNGPLAAKIFPKGVWRPDWSWISFAASCEHGPWAEGLPALTVVIGDLCLPWTYANMSVLRRLNPDGFRVWIKVPSKAVGEDDQRRRWARELETLLNGRLRLAKWVVDGESWGICPHSPVFDDGHREWGVPAWKNWDWLAPETLSRLDFSARLEGEAASYQRLLAWRNDQLKKQGARSHDHALHAP